MNSRAASPTIAHTHHITHIKVLTRSLRVSPNTLCADSDAEKAEADQRTQESSKTPTAVNNRAASPAAVDIKVLTRLLCVPPNTLCAESGAELSKLTNVCVLTLLCRVRR